MYVCNVYVYAWIALTYVPALAMYARACVRAHANALISARRACSYYQRPAPAMHAHAGNFFVKIVLSNGSFLPIELLNDKLHELLLPVVLVSSPGGFASLSFDQGVP